MKGRLALLMALVGLVAMLAGPAAAFDQHPHMLLQRPVVDVIDDVPHLVGYRKCVDLAGNRAVPLHAHHEQIHFAEAGVSFGGSAGHAIVPTAPLPEPFDEPLPWTDCDSFAEVLPLPLPGD